MINRAGTAAAAFLVALILVAAWTPSAALAAPNGKITGTVTDSHSAPINGGCVSATDPGVGFASGNTDASGAYTLSGLATGTYTVRFQACGAGPFAPETITGVQVTDGQTTTENASLADGATITGTVKDTSGNLLGGACVTANPSSPTGSGGSATTNASGVYTITNLPADTYRLEFTGCTAGDFQPSTVDGVVTTAGNTTTEDAALAPGGAISGHVKDTTATPLANACVSANPSGGGGPGGGAQTDAAGAYDIAGLAPGTYTVVFTACSAGNYAPHTDTGIQVTVGQTTTDDATLSTGAIISGTVTDSATTTPLVGVCVTATSSAPGGLGGNAITVAGGTYTINGLASGTYSVSFVECSAGNYQSKTVPAVQATAGQTTTQDAALDPGGTISGKVTDSTNSPLNGVCVSATPAAPGGQGGNALTDANGLYTITSLGSGTYALRFTPCSGGNFAPVTISGVQVTAGQTTTQDATLPAGATITGTVTNTSNAPLSGACVTVIPPAPGLQGGRATTDVNGAYSIDKLAAGTYTVMVDACTAGNYQSDTISGVQLSAGQSVTENVALAPGGTIAGTVTDGSANPIPGACVEAAPSGGGSDSVGKTDATGTYSLAGLAPGSYTVSFSACGAGNYAPKTVTGVQVTAGQTTTENASLVAGATISGNVTDTTNAPLGGVCVTASGLGGQGGSATTDGTGAYAIATLPAGTYTVTFRACNAGNYAPQTIPGVQATAGQTTTENVSLAPGATISGKVTDNTGNPLVGACVTASPSAPGGQGAQVHTDATGSYSIPALAAGTYTLAFTGCTAGNYVPHTITGVQATAGQTTTENASLTPAGTIAGKVTDGSGNPLIGACVSVASSAGGQSGGDTDSNGLYSLAGLPAGTYTLTVSACLAGNFAPDTITGVQVTAGATTTENVTLAPGGTISGKVTDSAGKALAGACVSAATSAPGNQEATTTDANGAYTITSLTPGSYTLDFAGCAAGSYAKQEITGVQVTAGQITTENAALATGGRIGGTVTDSSGSPLAGACVGALSSGGDVLAGSNTDANGHYTIADLAPGTYTVEFDGCSSGNFVSKRISSVQVVAGHLTTENASLAGAGALAGTVTDGSGTPLSGACVSAFPAGTTAGPGTNTDANGNYRFTGLAPGSYTVEFQACSAGNFASIAVTGVQVNAGQTTIKNAALAPGGTISGTVTDSTGKQLAGACVSATPSAAGGVGAGTDTDSNGHYTISGLAAGTYSVDFSGCSAGNYVDNTVSGVQVAAGQTTTENATLLPGGTIKGTVTDSSGKPLVGACVTVTTPGGQTGTINTDSNGAYNIPNVPPGTYTFTFSGCSAGTYLSKTFTGVQATAGQTTTLNVTLVQPATITGKVIGSGGSPLAGVCVSVTPSGGNATTSSTGVYTRGGLAAGTYTVTFKGCAAGTYLTQTITGVVVAAGQTVTENATLVRPGTITGKVTNAAGTALAGVCVSATPSGTATTNSAGIYTITNLAAGTYTLTFKGCSAGSYFTQTISGVAVAAGRTVTENAKLIQPGTITGKVTSSGGSPLAGVCVSATPSGGNTRTNSSGVYSYSGLTAGTYTLTFKGCTAGNYLTKTITGVVVTAGNTVTENATLIHPGTITGKVIGSDGSPLAGVCVSATPSGSATTNSSGVYTISNLVAGTYALTFKGCAAGTFLPKTITGVAVAEGKTVTENATLIHPGTITGRVTGSGGSPIGGVCVSAGPSGSATTNSAGVYTITNLAAGTYALTFKGCAAGTFLPKTISGVAVVAGQTVTENATLIRPGTITGKVTDAAGKALAGACVSVTPSGGNTATDASGVYTRTGLAAGTYTVTFKGCAAGSFATKTITGVVVAAGKTVTENATLVAT